MIASLPMYDTAATRAGNDAFWHNIRAVMGEGPQDLDRDSDPHQSWLDPALLFSQTCGLPLRTELLNRVTMIGTPDYNVDGCPPGYYCSRVVVRGDDPRQGLADYNGATLARNDKRSQSGWAAIENHLVETDVPMSFVGHTFDTGAHALSARAVAEGRADVAAIDAVTWDLLCRDTEITAGLRVLTSTRPTPGLPFITAKGRDVGHMFGVIAQAIETLTPAQNACLKINGIVKIDHNAYLAESLPPTEGCN